MEKKLRKLFDYQKFARNKHLDSLIKETLEEEKGLELSDELLGAVAAGGEPQKQTRKIQIKIEDE